MSKFILKFCFSTMTSTPISTQFQIKFWKWWLNRNYPLILFNPFDSARPDCKSDLNIRRKKMKNIALQKMSKKHF